MSSEPHSRLTVADLDAFPEDDGNCYELIEGELFVSRAPRLPHQLVLQNLQVALAIHLQRHPIGILVAGPGAVFSDYDAVIPDLAFVRNERWKEIIANERFERAPDLIVEVLSPGKANHDRDLRAKRRLYGKYGVAEYWIVDPESRAVYVYRLRKDILHQMETLTGEDQLQSPLLPQFHVSVNTIFNIPLK